LPEKRDNAKCSGIRRGEIYNQSESYLNLKALGDRAFLIN